MPEPTWQSEDGRVALYCGDCLAILPTLAPGSVDAVVTDPPYGVDWPTNYHFSCRNSGVRKYAERLPRRAHKPITGDDQPFDPAPLMRYPIVVLWGANNFSEKLPQGSWLIWDKRDAMDNAYLSEAEGAWMNKGKSVRMFKHCWQGFSRASENSQHYHPTQKPVALMAWCLDVAKVPSDALVLDPYMGSCPVGLACICTGRRFIGIEIDPRYFDIAKARIERELRQPRLPLPEPAPRAEQPMLLEVRE